MNKPARKIIICCNAYPPNFVGGAELIAHYQAKTLKQFGHDVVIFAGDTHVQGERYSVLKDIYDDLIVYRVHLMPQDYQSDFINFFHPKVEDRFRELLDNFSPDIVHFHNIIGLSVGIIHITKSRGIRTVLTVHDHWGFCYKNTLLKREEKICEDYTKCEECLPFIQDENMRGIPIRMRKDFFALQLDEIDAFISPSHYLAEAYIKAGIPKEKFNIIWYGIDLQRFGRISKSNINGCMRFTFIGYIGKHKGVHVLLNALSLIRKDHCYHVNIVGEGDMTDACKQQVKAMGLNDVKFWGKIDNSRIDEVYRETDVLILPSIWPENQPVTITEAMAAKIPVIASDTGGIPELVEDGKTGYLFEPGSAKELAQKMSEFIFNPDRVRSFGENAYNKISEYKLGNQVEKIIKVYNRDKVEEIKKPYEEMLIICTGKRMDPKCSRAMDLFLKKNPLQTYRFVMSDWLQADQIRKAKILWVVDKETSQKEVIVGLKNKIPLLVPESNNGLKKLCIKGNCGLYYGDALEALVCLEYLTNYEIVRIALGQNGFKLHGYF